MSDVRFEGLLQKPGRIPGRKTKVWCVLSDQELLFYRENKRSSCVGSLELSLVRKVEKVVSNERDFRVDHKGKVVVYTAEDSAKRDEWITNLLDVLHANCNKQVPLAQNTVKCKLDTSRKQTLQDQGEISIQSRILSRKLSGVNNTVPRINDQTTFCENNISQGGQNSSRKEGPNLKEEDKPEVKKTFAKETTTVAKEQPSNESHVFTSSGSSRRSKEAVTVKTDTIRQSSVQKVSETVNKEGESTTNFETEPVNSRRSDANGKIKQESFDLTKNIVGRSSIVPSTGKESRPDSGYETLAGSENRRSIITEEYGEVDISRVVMRRSRRSINSLTMNNSESEVPKIEQVPVSNGIKDTKTTSPEQNPLRENHIEEENCDDLSQECGVSNGDLHADVNEEESDTVYENIASLRKEKTLENSVKTVNEEHDVVVPMRRRVPSKRTTLVDMHVPQVVEEAEEDDEHVDDIIPATEGQEEMLMNLTFEPIEELPFKGKDMQSDEYDFSEIREILSHRKSPVRESVSLDPVEELRKLLEQV